TVRLFLAGFAARRRAAPLPGHLPEAGVHPPPPRGPPPSSLWVAALFKPAFGVFHAKLRAAPPCGPAAPIASCIRAAPPPARPPPPATGRPARRRSPAMTVPLAMPAPRKLPVWSTVWAGYVAVGRNIGQLVRISWLWLLVLLPLYAAILWLTWTISAGGSS